MRYTNIFICKYKKPKRNENNARVNIRIKKKILGVLLLNNIILLLLWFVWREKYNNNMNKYDYCHLSHPPTFIKRRR